MPRRRSMRKSRSKRRRSTRPTRKKRTKRTRAVKSSAAAEPIAPKEDKSFWGDVKKGIGAATSAIPKGTLSAVGTGLGSAFGMPGVGGAAGRLVSQILGFGDYDVKSNTLMKLNMGQPVPTFGNMRQGMIINHREYITDVLAPGSTAFSNNAFPIQPGMNTTFPWLSTLAANFDQYRIKGMIFEFKSTSSDYAVNAGLGSIVMATEYDAVDPVYTSKSQMENSQYCVSGKPSTDIIHPIECDPRFNNGDILFTRNGVVPSGKDVRLYDHGVFQIAVIGCPASAGVALGELWVTYQIELLKPQLGQGGFYDHFSFTASEVSGTNKRYFGTTDELPAELGSSVQGSIEINAAGSVSYYVFPPSVSSGIYCINYTVTGASTAVSPELTAATLVNCSTALTYVNQTRASVYTPPCTTDTVFLSATIQVTGPGAKWGITTGQLPGSVTGADLWVHKLNDNSQ